jgi:hypothetical protein
MPLKTGKSANVRRKSGEWFELTQQDVAALKRSTFM